MASQVSICNQALGWIGGNLITSIDDGSKEANLCKANYDDLRDAVLEERNWTFATRRQALTPLAQDPPFGYAKQFTLPADLIRLIGAYRPGMEDREQAMYVREENRLLTDEPRLNIVYIARIKDANRFSAGFVQCFAARLASDLAIPIAESRSLQETMWALYEAKLESAGTNDGMQGRFEQKQANRLVRSRR